ncbi:MAG TPA: RIP metalloprotease RseP [Sandaracinaceae bacterium LLY-WYZ-13_1]|nr:RIP metalloprotease RseP [Sandaracinaceae bacterium LLY-WYZ-13_1]
MEVVYFIVLVGVLIFVHELGHFAWAKFFGVKVLKFSLGFGPKIAGFSRGDTEYVVAAFPLGGYVRMLGESPHDRIRAEDADRAFSRQALWKRVVIVFAGPAMNLVFPIALFFVVFLGDAQMTPAVIGTVFPDRPADGVLEPGDRVVRADGEDVASFYELARIIHAHPEEPVELVVERDGERRTVTVTPFLARSRRPLDLVDEVGRIGIKPHHPVAVVGVTSPSSPAAAAGLRTFDRIITVGGHPQVERWTGLEDALAANRGTSVPVSYLRPTRVPDALGGLVELDVYEPHATHVVPEPGPGDGLSRAGLEPVDLYVSTVTTAAPSVEVGVRPGDRLTTLDGRPIRLWATLVEDVEAQPDRVHRLGWRRGDQNVARDYRLRAARTVTGDDADQRILVLDAETEAHLATLGHWRPTVLDDPIPNPSPILYAVDQAFRVTAELVELTVYSVVRLIQGRLSVRSIGGPIRVFEATEAAAREGALNYLSLMAFISINLGLINLLPIPMLDGGHLVFFFVEAVARRPVSTRIREIASLVGLVLLVALMVLAFKNDLERQWPRITEAFEAER